MGSEDTEDFEELFVFAEFDGLDITGYNRAHLLGVDSSHPIIQMDDTFFKGKYEMPVGTFMFFQEDPTPECADPVFHKLPEKSLKYLCKSTKYVKMEKAYIAPKDGSDPAVSKQTEMNIKPITFSSVDSALARLREEWKKNGDGDGEDEDYPLKHDDETISQNVTPIDLDSMDTHASHNKNTVKEESR